MDYIKIEATDLTYVLGNIDKIYIRLHSLSNEQIGGIENEESV